MRPRPPASTARLVHDVVGANAGQADHGFHDLGRRRYVDHANAICRIVDAEIRADRRATVLGDSLSVGEVYFSVIFLDEEILIPTLDPVVFIGKDLSPGDVEKPYFQDAASYRDGIRFGPDAAETGAMFYSGSIKSVFTYERALDLLLARSLRRREQGAHLPSLEGPAGAGEI
jgi:hypothetical protein